jgi:flagellar hook-basal body complex protein FliE
MDGISKLSSLSGLLKSPEGLKADKESFKKTLLGFMDQVNELQNRADRSIEKLISGEAKDLHQVMIAAEEATISFQLMVELRNKILEAYHEVMRIQV